MLGSMLSFPCLEMTAYRKTELRVNPIPIPDISRRMLGITKKAMEISNSVFSNLMVCLSPSRMGIVSRPTIRSPCISRMSKKAVLMNTIQTDQANTSIVLNPKVLFNAIGGTILQMIPQANAISTVLEPGISRIR